MTHIKELIHSVAPPVVFNPLAAILTPFINHYIHEVITAMAKLGDMKVKQQQQKNNKIHNYTEA